MNWKASAKLPEAPLPWHIVSPPDFVATAWHVSKSIYADANNSSPSIWIQSSGRHNVPCVVTTASSSDPRGCQAVRNAYCLAGVSHCCPLKQVMFWALMWRWVKSGGGKVLKRSLILHRDVSLSLCLHCLTEKNKVFRIILSWFVLAEVPSTIV